jgi:hypothetical protein
VGLARGDKEWPRQRGTRHVWVLDDNPLKPPHQGLVLAWARHSYRWRALTIFTCAEDDGSVSYTMRWFPVERLAPVPSDANNAFVFRGFRELGRG